MVCGLFDNMIWIADPKGILTNADIIRQQCNTSSIQYMNSGGCISNTIFPTMKLWKNPGSLEFQDFDAYHLRVERLWKKAHGSQGQESDSEGLRPEVFGKMKKCEN